jgi:sugar phosphate isomerase/epimerase
MELGCSTILYGGQPLGTALERIGAAGYRAIELCAIPGMAPHVSPSSDPADLRRRVEAAGLAIESLGASGSLSRETIELAGRLGAPAITSGSGGSSDDEASFRETVERIAQLAGVASDLGVTISLKPHVRQAVYSTPTALRFMEQIRQRVDPGAVGLNVDASHLIRAGEDPVDALSRLARHVATARIRDATRGVEGPGPVERQIPGDGDLDVAALAAAIAALPRPRYAVLEIVGTKDMPLDEIDRVVRTSHQRLTQLFARS